ncbi:MAG TPA: hypothetical protein EYG11_16895 [Candidatus Latescibacteria bacterium]|nr:hypothetical protein [Candidatus Handelsmanbacteria bacterium]HIL10380.1 hypothetical protein [Candidatus Latescibacterota bacterium]
MAVSCVFVLLEIMIQESSANSRCDILIVDDTLANLRLLTDRLCDQGLVGLLPLTYFALEHLVVVGLRVWRSAMRTSPRRRAFFRLHRGLG